MRKQIGVTDWRAGDGAHRDCVKHTSFNSVGPAVCRCIVLYCLPGSRLQVAQSFPSGTQDAPSMSPPTVNTATIARPLPDTSTNFLLLGNRDVSKLEIQTYTHTRNRYKILSHRFVSVCVRISTPLYR